MCEDLLRLGNGRGRGLGVACFWKSSGIVEQPVVREWAHCHGGEQQFVPLLSAFESNALRQKHTMGFTTVV